jgi:fructokinase
MSTRSIVAALGEVLWDVFPDASHFGGAPANFACHAAALGAEAGMVSAVGDDDLGRRAIATLRRHRVRTQSVAVDPQYPTGQVLVSINSAGVPTYKIAEDRAWDHIAWSEKLIPLATRCDAACFGSLGQRSPVSRATIRHFLRDTRPDALRVFDVNLRQNFFDRDTLNDSLHVASVLKLNDEELPIIADMLQVFGDSHRELLGSLAARFDLRLAALTRGPKGSLLFAAGEFDECPSPATDVVDTVGAGDAFTAAMVTGFLRELPLSAINRACERGGLICLLAAGCNPAASCELADAGRELKSPVA